MKKQISVLTALLTAAAFAVTGCGASGDNAAPSASSKAASQEVPEETEHSEAESTEAENTGAETGSEAVSEEEKEGSGASAVRVGSLKGPTSMGLAYLMETAKNGETANTYEFTMAGKADELVGNIANGSLDIALVPANVASVLYNKTQGQVKVIDINTLGVLYVDNPEADEASLAERIPITPLVAFCYMLFVLIYFPCIAALAAIKQESGSWKWALFAACYTTGLAWLVAFSVYQIGGLFV